MKSAIIATLALVLLGNGVHNSSVNGDHSQGKVFPSVPKHMIDATVMVRTMIGRGSGVYVGDGLFVTAGHVVTDQDGKPEDGIEVEVQTLNHGGKAYVPATLMALDVARDVAIVKTKIAHKQKAELGEEADLSIGDALFTIGAPAYASIHTATLGYMAEKSADQFGTGDLLLWQSSNAVWFGNSGGPVFDANSGKLVGIVVQVAGIPGRGYAPNCCFFVSLDIIKALLKESR